MTSRHHLYTHLKTCLFALFKRQSKTDRESSHPLVQSPLPATARVGPGQSQGHAAPAGAPVWVVGTQLLGYLVLSRGCISRKPALGGWEPGLWPLDHTMDRSVEHLSGPPSPVSPECLQGARGF